MFNRIGAFVTKYRGWVILTWLVAAVLLFVFAPSLSEVGQVNNSAFLPGDAESTRAGELVKQYFPGTETSSSDASLIFFNASGLTEADLNYASQARDWLKTKPENLPVTDITSIFDNPSLKSTLISPDNTTMLMNVGTSGDMESGEATKIIRAHFNDVPSSLEVYVSGEMGIEADMKEAVMQGLDKTTLITIVLVIVLLLLIYRSPVASLVPLLTIGIAYLVSRGVLGLIAQAGVNVWSQMDSFLIVLVFGVGTDYCLFLISRFREELTRQDTRTAAMRHTVGMIGMVITASAFTVILGLSGMAIAKFDMIKTMGPLMALTVFITLLAAVTMTPAFASLMGRFLFWPQKARSKQDSRTAKPAKPSFFERMANLSTRKPVPVIIVILVLLLLPCLAIPGSNRSFNTLKELPTNSEAAAGFDIMEQHYDIGEMEPMGMLIVTPQGTNISAPDSLAALSKVSQDLRQVKGVIKVRSIIDPMGSGQTLDALTVSGQLNTLSSSLDSSGSGSDASALFSDQITAGFQMMGAYLTELQNNFSWVKEDADYQKAVATLNQLSAMITQMKNSALVSNELETLASSLTITPADSSATAPTAQQISQYLMLIMGYLQELGQQYPDIQSDQNYQSALQTCAQGLTLMGQMQSLPPAEQAQSMASLQAGLQQLGQSLTGLANEYKGKDVYLISQVLMKASGSDNTSPQAAIQAQGSALKSSLAALSARFKDNGNPAFLSQTLAAASTDLQNMEKQFISSNQQATRLYVVLDSYPASESAIQTTMAVRDEVKTSLEQTSLKGSQALTSGSSAMTTDIKNMLDTDFNRIMILVVVVTFLVLVFVLRSLIAPIYLILAVLLSYGATIGLVTLIFQNLLGQDGISFMIPVIIFVLLIALGSDYNIFLMSRVREESTKRPTRDGARIAAVATGFVIMACGLILAGTFASLASSPIRTMIQMGAAIAIGVIIDTCIMQTFLIPALAAKLGKWNWWPAKRG